MPLEAEFIAAVADRAAKPHFDEWSACCAAALEGTGGDWKGAVAIADEVLPGVVEECGTMESASVEPLLDGLTPLLESVTDVLLEGYDPTAGLRNNELEEDRPGLVVHPFKVGEHNYIASAGTNNRKMRNYDIVFSRERTKDGPSTQQLTNDTGALAPKVFAHVGRLVSHVINKYNPEAVSFSGVTGKRAKLYDRFASQIAKAHGRVLRKNLTGDFDPKSKEIGSGRGEFSIIRKPDESEGGWASFKRTPEDAASEAVGKLGVDRAHAEFGRIDRGFRDRLERATLAGDDDEADRLKRSMKYMRAAQWHLDYNHPLSGES